MSALALDLTGHASFLLTAISFWLRDILLLRWLAVASGTIGVAYNYLIPAGPLWLVIFWLCVFVAINLYRILTLLRERRAVAFSEEERELYETLFRHFAPVEFMKLMRLARWEAAAPGQELARQGEPVGRLKLIYNGEVAILRDGVEVARGRDGTLIGEMSFVQGGPATATVRVLRPTRYLAWPKDALAAMMRRNPTMDVALNTVFSRDMARKLGGGAPA